MECNICMERLNATERRPKCIVPCGHTVCLHCLRRIGTQICPECRQGFAKPVDALPDNYFLLGLIEKGQHSRTDTRLWCRACSKVSSVECADLGHAVCSLRKLRAEQAAPKLQQLESAVASALTVVQALEQAQGAVEAQLAEWRARLHQAMEAQSELRAAANAGRDVAAALPQGLEQWQQAAGLLEAGCRMQMQLQGEHGIEWNGYLQRQDGGSLLAPLVLHLHQHGGIKQVLQVEPDVAEDQVSFSLHECLVVSTKTLRRELEAVLQDPNLDKVRKLDGIDCGTWHNWSKVLLQRVAPRVEWLSVSNALRAHFDAIAEMPSLRYLGLHTMLDFDTAAADLPLQLEDLVLVNVLKQHLQSIQRLPNLRKLTLRWMVGAPDVQFPPLPPGHRGLQWLRVLLQAASASTVLSLVKAHAATLQELRILTASEGESKWHHQDLADRLRKCGLVALRRLVLLRVYNPNNTKVKIDHSEESCLQQKDALWDSLLAVDAGRAVRVVEVLCEVCDKCPAFPAPGDFTWK